MTTRKKRVLIVGAGNAARSQMAEGLLRHDCGTRFDVESAGTRPAPVLPQAVAVMAEIGIDIRAQRSKHVDDVKGQDFDFVITVSDAARAACPMFAGKAKSLHKTFDDPALPAGSDEERMALSRRVRDDLRLWLASFARAIRA